MLTRVAAAQPEIQTNTSIVTAGYFQLEWRDNTSTNQQFKLQQSEDVSFSSFKTLYQGYDSATVLSGLANGTYFYRVATPDGETSEPIRVEVKHHSLNKALWFFCLGAVMFIVLVGILLSASWQKEPI